jgi:hypothetical protein
VAKWTPAELAFNEAALLIAESEIAKTMKSTETMVFPTISAQRMVGIGLWCDDG